MIASLLGVPPEDRDMVRGWIDESFYLDPGKGMSNDISEAMFSFMDYLARRSPIARRTRATTCSPIS